MAFVPEGQADSSQARSASGIELKRLRHGGAVEVIVSRIGSIVPLGRGHFPRDSRHFVPGTSCRPSGTKTYLRAPGLDPPVTSGRRTIPNSPYLRAIQPRDSNRRKKVTTRNVTSWIG